MAYSNELYSLLHEAAKYMDACLQVVSALQKHYLEHGPAHNWRDLAYMLDETFSDQGGRKYPHGLFSHGRVAQGMRFAGLPVPPHNEGEGFGTAN